MYKILLIVACFALVGCAIEREPADQTVINKSTNTWTEVVVETDKNDLFKKKQTCLEYRKDMFAYAKMKYSWVWQMGDIFYSPKKDSCFFVVRDTRDIDESRTRDFFILFDYLNQKVVAETPLNYRWEPFNADDYNKALTELEK